VHIIASCRVGGEAAASFIAYSHPVRNRNERAASIVTIQHYLKKQMKQKIIPAFRNKPVKNCITQSRKGAKKDKAITFLQG
jgi:hypothetical protein